MTDQVAGRRLIAARVLGYSNSAFADPHAVVSAAPATNDPKEFTFVGSKMDGFESQRHLTTRLTASATQIEFDPTICDWITLGLMQRARIDTIAISTRYFTGNQVEAVSIYLLDEMTGERTQVLDRQPLKPDAEHQFSIPSTKATEVRIECFYDGGITRVHFFGEIIEPLPVRQNLLATATISDVSNSHYGGPAAAVANDRQIEHMEGWQSDRRGFGDQARFTLAAPSTIDELVVDTYKFIFNAPLTCHLFGLDKSKADSNQAAMASAPRWQILLQNGQRIVPKDLREFMRSREFLAHPTGKLQKMHFEIDLPPNSPWRPMVSFAPLNPDTFHRFRSFEYAGPCTDLLFMYFPNGGIHGLKVYGR